jgi:hypothetical protein
MGGVALAQVPAADANKAPDQLSYVQGCRETAAE